MNGGKFILPKFSKRRLIFYLVTIAAIIGVYLEFSELRLISRVFLGANRFWLIGILATQFFTYYFLALNYKDILQMKDIRIKVHNLFFPTFVIQFLNQVIPSATVSGQIFFIQYLKKYGVTLLEGIGRAILEIMTMALAFGIFFLGAIVILTVDKSLTGNSVVSYILYIFFFMSLAFIGMFFAFQGNCHGRIANWFIEIFRRLFGKYAKRNGTDYFAVVLDQMRENFSLRELNKNRLLFWRAVLWQGVIVLLNIFTLYFISYAIGSKAAFSVVFIAFVLTKFISMISVVPGSLGIFEGGMTLILMSFGVDAGPALAMTLLFRAVSFWIPIPIGWFLYRYYTHRAELENL